MYNLKFCRHTLCEFGWQWIGLKQYLFGGIVPVYITFKVEYSVPFQDFINYSSLHTKCLKNEYNIINLFKLFVLNIKLTYSRILEGASASLSKNIVFILLIES